MTLRFNVEDEANEGLCERARFAVDVARRVREEADRSRLMAKKARDALGAAQHEYHDRRAWLPPMALILLGLDSWAVHFAAEALGGDQRVTLLWAALFLVILGFLEAGLAWSAERSKKIFRLIAAGLAAFATLLALLRFGFLAAVGAGLADTPVGACLFTVCTIMFVAGGFTAIRNAERATIWQAGCRAQKALKKAGTRPDLVGNRADVAALAKLTPAGLLLERQGSVPRGQAKGISHASTPA